MAHTVASGVDSTFSQFSRLINLLYALTHAGKLEWRKTDSVPDQIECTVDTVVVVRITALKGSAAIRLRITKGRLQDILEVEGDHMPPRFALLLQQIYAKVIADLEVKDADLLRLTTRDEGNLLSIIESLRQCN